MYSPTPGVLWYFDRCTVHMMASCFFGGRSEDNVITNSSAKPAQPTKPKKTDTGSMTQTKTLLCIVIMAILTGMVAGESPPTTTSNTCHNQYEGMIQENNGTDFVQVNPTDDAAPHKDFFIFVPVKVSEFRDMRIDTLRRHNHHRKRHNASPLKMSLELTKYSQHWANKLAKTDSFRHRPYIKHGENIYLIMSSRVVSKVGVKAVDTWYNEKQHFNFHGSEEEMLKSFNKTGHLTQVLWKNTKMLGVGVSKGVNGKIYVVCNYEPHGNVRGHFKENVLPPINLKP